MRLISAIALLILVGCINQMDAGENEKDPGNSAIDPVPPIDTKIKVNLTARPQDLLPFELTYQQTFLDEPGIWQNVTIFSNGTKRIADAFGYEITGLSIGVHTHTSSGANLEKEIVVDANGRLIRIATPCYPNPLACERYSMLFSPGNPGPVGLHGPTYFNENWALVHDGAEQMHLPATWQDNWLNITGEYQSRLFTLPDSLQPGSFHYGNAGPFADEILANQWHSRLVNSVFGNSSVQIETALHPTLPPHTTIQPFSAAEYNWTGFPVSSRDAWNFLWNFELAIDWGAKSCTIGASAFRMGESVFGQIQTYRFHFDVYHGLQNESYRYQAQYHKNISAPGVWELGPKQSSSVTACSQLPKGGEKFSSLANLTKQLSDQSWWVNHEYQKIPGLEMHDSYGDMFHVFLRIPPTAGVSKPMNLILNEHLGGLYLVEGPAEEFSEMDSLLRNWPLL